MSVCSCLLEVPLAIRALHSIKLRVNSFWRSSWCCFLWDYDWLLYFFFKFFSSFRAFSGFFLRRRQRPQFANDSRIPNHFNKALSFRFPSFIAVFWKFVSNFLVWTGISSSEDVTCRSLKGWVIDRNHRVIWKVYWLLSFELFWYFFSSFDVSNHSLWSGSGLIVIINVFFLLIFFLLYLLWFIALFLLWLGWLLLSFLLRRCGFHL